MPLYYVSGGCNLLIENTHQLVLYESTGIIEVLIFSKQPCTPWNEGRAMIGIQNAAKNQAVMVNNRKASDPPWGTPGMQEAYRFVPAAGASLFKRVELCDLAGTVLATGTTTNLGNGKLEASFPNVCPVIGSTVTYVIRSVYSKFDNPAVEILGTDTLRVTKSANPYLNATASSTNTDCYTPTGSITVTVPPGVSEPPYLFQLDGGAIVSGTSPHTFTNVGPGLHTVLVTDPTGTCSSTINITVNKNNSLTANTSSTATACAAVFTGTITATATSGIAPYLFLLDGPPAIPAALSHTFTNVGPGPHNVTVTDATGCATNTIVVNVLTGAGVNGNISGSTPTSCAAVANGTVVATATAGIAPFTWQLDGGAIVSGVSPYTFTNVAAGAHTVTIYDNVGCSKAIVTNVVAGPGVSGITSSTLASCQGVNNATITTTATAGIAPFTWQLDGGAFQTGANPYTFTNISGGMHTVVIRDNVGCTQSINHTVLSGPAIAATTTATATSCNGASNGTITVTPTNGTGPYRFSLDGAPTVTGAIPYTFFNVGSGFHNIIVTDGPGCVSNIISVNVIPGPSLTTTINKTDALCNGSATGTITVAQPALGVPPFQYSVDGISWQNSNIFNGLTAGFYTVFYRSSNGCFGSQAITIAEPSLLTAATSTIPVVCNGESNGTITISPGGGVSPYQFSIDGGTTWQGSNTFIVPAGNYTASIRDVNNCVTTRPVSVTQPSLLTAASTNANASCDGGNDGRITVNANGGNSNYMYSINGVTFQASNVFLVPPGTYTVKVKDNLGCATSFNTTVGLTVNLFLASLTDPTICNGTSTQLNAVSNATIYSWTPSIGLSNTNIHNPIANPTDSTKYIVTATLGRCTTYDTVIVKVNSAPIPNAGPDGDICYGQSYTLQGSGGSQYFWTPAIYLNTTSGANPIATPSKTTTYTLSVIDAIGCHSLVTDEVKVITSRPMRINTFPYDTTAYQGDQFQLLATSAGISYTWLPISGLSNPNIANPIVTVGNTGEEITYQVVGVTQEGCKGEGYVKIRVYKGPDIYVPTGFTPNSDGKNDKFTPFPVGISSYNYFRVFNRWGQLLFSTNRLNDGWDGKTDGKEQAAGVYVWMIEGVTKNNKVITKKGTITLIR
jgi:gliding motility-associated-like protein